MNYSESDRRSKTFAGVWHRVVYAVKQSVPLNFDMISEVMRSCDACGGRVSRRDLFPISKHPIIKHACQKCVGKLKLRVKGVSGNLPLRRAVKEFVKD